MNKFSWLHFSDFHQGFDRYHSDKGRLQELYWPNIREALCEDLTRLHEINGPWHAVFFTGDLAYGGEHQEYEALTTKFASILNHVKKLGSRPVFLSVPGNHDLIRPAAKLSEVKELLKWHKQQHVRARFWANRKSPNRRFIEKAFSGYTSWWAKSGLPLPGKISRGALPGEFATSVKVQGGKIGVVGLNSAFLQLDGTNFEGRLDLCLEQFAEVCGGDGPKWCRDHDFCILLTHHPPEWLSDAGRKVLQNEIAPPGRFIAHLYGHMHEHRAWESGAMGHDKTRYIQGCSLFGLETYLKNGKLEENRAHGYASGTIEFDESVTSLRLWPRVAQHHKGGGWQVVPEVAAGLKEDQGTPPERFNRHSAPKKLSTLTKPGAKEFRTVNQAPVLDDANAYSELDFRKGRESTTKLDMLLELETKIGQDKSFRLNKSQLLGCAQSRYEYDRIARYIWLWSRQRPRSANELLADVDREFARVKGRGGASSLRPLYYSLYAVFELLRLNAISGLAESVRRELNLEEMIRYIRLNLRNLEMKKRDLTIKLLRNILKLVKQKPG